MDIQHKPDDKLMVDWAGTALTLYDEVTGNSSRVYLFAATLPFFAASLSARNHEKALKNILDYCC